MAREGLRYQTFSRRALLMAGLQGAALTGLAGRLYYLAIIEGDKYKLRAEKNRVSLRLISPERGIIYDRYNRRLATNQPDFRVFLVPEQAGNVDDTLDKLGHIVRLDVRQLRRIRRLMKRQRKFVPVTVAQRLDWQTFSRVNVSLPYLPGVLPDSGLSRYYPNGHAIAHLIGYLGSPREEDIGQNPLYQLPGFKVGRQGLERRLEDRLRGTAGTRRVEVNAVGREIRELPPRQEATRGNNLKLTIDLALQKYAAELMGENAAGAVALDIKSGDVLAFASTPTYDPNEFTNGMSQENWQALIGDPRKPLLNKCIGGQFPPGSTVKPYVAIAALEKGVVTEETKYFCNGKHRLGNHTFHCWQNRGHGMQTLKEAISNSCDVYYYKLAEEMDVDELAEMARKFGMGEVFNIGLDGEKPGLVPTREWKERTQRQRWQKGETLITSIGQGAVLATPLQLAVMSARFATGRKVLPRLILEGDDSVQTGLLEGEQFEDLGINPLHMRIIQRGMEMVTEPGGTAHDYARRKSAVKQAGKTGTAQVRRITQAERDDRVLENDELPWNARDHALYIGYAPVEDPRVAVSVLVQHGGGGSKVAAPIARALLDKALELIDQDPQAVKGDDGDTEIGPNDVIIQGATEV